MYKKNPGIAILRKDFLVDEQELDISYACGADAVLLIARILDIAKLCSMAKKALSLGLSILCEIREEEDLEKYKVMCSTVHKGNAPTRLSLLTGESQTQRVGVLWLFLRQPRSCLQRR